MEPQDREETYLASIAGQNVETPACPWNRKEAYLDEIDQHVEGMEGDIAKNTQDISDLNQKVAALATDFSYKGSVADYAHLPSDAAVGDVYTTEDEGYMYVWDGTQWQILNMTGAGALTGSADPTTSTEGTLGQLYLNTASGELFYCSATGDTYTWVSLDSPIQSISVNGTAVTPDANKNVALTIPDNVYYFEYATPLSSEVKAELQTRITAKSPIVFKWGDYWWNVSAQNAQYSSSQIGLPITRTELNSTRTLKIVEDYVTYDLRDDTWGHSGERAFEVIDNLTSGWAYTALSAKQGKVLKDLVDSLVIKNVGAPTTSTTGTKGQLLEDTTNGNLYICTNSASPYAWKQIDKDEILTNAGAPTTSTAGTLGQLLTDTTNAKLYQLTAIDNTDPQAIVYTWTEVGGSSGPTVVQTTGTSTTDVMSQDAATKLVYDNSSIRRNVVIGLNASASGNSWNRVIIGTAASSTFDGGIAIGNSASATNDRATVLSANSSASGKGSVALGAFSSATAQGQIDIGSTNTAYGYSSSNYRLLTGLYDPQSAHDAATKGYVDGTTETLTIADTDWAALSSSDPYTYSATVSVTATIGANSTVSLINDAAVDFATYGFAIGSVDQPNNAITLYSIGAPSVSKSLTINIKG